MNLWQSLKSKCTENDQPFPDQNTLSHWQHTWNTTGTPPSLFSPCNINTSLLGLSLSKIKTIKARAFKCIFMVNDLRIEYLLRNSVPKVGRQDQGKEIVIEKLCHKGRRSSPPFTQQIQVMFYYIPVTIYIAVFHMEFPGPRQLQPQPNTTIQSVFGRWPQAQGLGSSHRMVKAEACHIVHLILSWDGAREMQPSSSLLTLKQTNKKLQDKYFWFFFIWTEGS